MCFKAAADLEKTGGKFRPVPDVFMLRRQAEAVASVRKHMQFAQSPIRPHRLGEPKRIGDVDAAVNSCVPKKGRRVFL